MRKRRIECQTTLQQTLQVPGSSTTRALLRCYAVPNTSMWWQKFRLVNGPWRQPTSSQTHRNWKTSFRASRYP